MIETLSPSNCLFRTVMWGNRFGVLGALLDFARRHPNVVLELKIKSKNIAYLLKHPVPRNLILPGRSIRSASSSTKSSGPPGSQQVR